MENKIAVVTSQTIDFVAYAHQVYKAIKSDKSRLQNGRLITIEHGNTKTAYYHVMDLDDCAGIAFDSFVRLSSDAVEANVFECLKIRGAKEI